MDDVTYEDLYARWERGNWSATEIDFSVDREHWRERLTDVQRRAILWNASNFLHGEDAVADGLGPYIDAAPREEQKYFLSTQQVDEARHTVFFKRFMEEVVLERGGTAAQVLGRTEQHLTWGARQLFGRLDQMAKDLRREPTPQMLAGGVALYHLIIEGTLAQPAQHAMDGFLERAGVLPGFTEGMRNIAFDEQRHIAFGMKMLAELIVDPACRHAANDVLREVMPYAMTLAIPPNLDAKTYFESLGFTMEELYAEAQAGMFHKMRLVGLPYESLNGAVPFPPGQTVEETVPRSMTLIRGNYIGEKRGPVARDPDSVRVLMETVQYAVDHRHAPPKPTTIQWDFDDLDTWHLVIDNGSTRLAQGAARDADLRLACRFEDWVDVVAGRQDPRKLMLTRRLRPRGSARTLLRLEKLFG